ncbi:MAG TPA: hypothetical protein ENJ60_03880 [Aeromonadales bacterium]|nr:hypothetical protein [Aeromonadales bacterium]
MKKFISGIILFILITAIYRYDSSPEQIIDSQSKEISLIEKQNIVSEQNVKTGMPGLAEKSPADCDQKLLKKLNNDVFNLWQDLRLKFYNEKIDSKMIKFASKSAEFEGEIYLDTPDETEVSSTNLHSNNSKINNAMSSILKIILGTNFEQFLMAIDNNQFEYLNQDIYSDEGLLGKIISILYLYDRKELPSKQQIQHFLNSGYHISNKDYIEISKLDLPIEYVEDFVALGPLPESLNEKFSEAPIFISAQKGDRKQVLFWVEHNYTKINNISDRNFTDELMLNSIDHQSFNENWSLLKQWGLFIRSPKTARTLLKRKFLNISGTTRKELLALSLKNKPQVLLSSNEQSQLNYINSLIEATNLKADAILRPVKTCFTKDLAVDSNKPDLPMKLFEQGKSIDDIVKILAKSPLAVDIFRQNLQRGKYKPFYRPKFSPRQRSQATYKLLIASSEKNWKTVRQILSDYQVDNMALASLLASYKPIPEKLRSEIENKLTDIPVDFISSSEWISPKLLEKIDIPQSSINKTNFMKRNLFYYATKYNKPELMRWLVARNSDMVSDEYGTDPMDITLMWDTHPKTLKTLCDLNFPIKSKHKKMFNKIQQDDPEEAKEILQNCPMFAEQ